MTKFEIEPVEHTVELTLGFGAPLLRKVQIACPQGHRHRFAPSDLNHDHVVYTWPKVPGQTSERRVENHRVFPAVLSTTTDLKFAVDKHLSKLLDEPRNFAQFPLYDSPLKVLRTIHNYYYGLKNVGQPHSSRNLVLD
jgi:hypothetical protein